MRVQLTVLHRKIDINVREEKGGLVIRNDLRSFKVFMEKISFTLGVRVCKGNGKFSPHWEGYEKNNLLRSMVRYLKKLKGQ